MLEPQHQAQGRQPIHSLDQIPSRSNRHRYRQTANPHCENHSTHPKTTARASRSPGITDSSTPTSRRRDTNTPELRASRLALVARATTQSTAHASITLRYSATWATVRSIASGKSSPEASTPSPKFVIALWRATCRVPEASTSATSKRLVTVPISIAATLMRRTFLLALPSCFHCKERAGEFPRLESCFIERRYTRKEDRARPSTMCRAFSRSRNRFENAPYRASTTFRLQKGQPQRQRSRPSTPNQAARARHLRCPRRSKADQCRFG